MHNAQHRYHRTAGLLGLALVGVLAGPAMAADWNIIVSRSAAQPEQVQLLTFRPNVEERVFLFVENQTASGEKVTVRLAKPGPDPGVLQPLAEKSVFVGSKKTERVSFAKAEPEAKPAEGKPAPPAFTPLTGPPFDLVAHVLRIGENGQEERLANLALRVRVLSPHEQVEAAQAAFQSSGRTLSLPVRARANFSGLTPCPVELVLSPDHVPGLIPGRKEGAYERQLTAPGQEVQLVARNLQFVGGEAPKEGRVTVTVDGCPRAIAYNIAFTTDGLQLSQLAAPFVRLPTPRIVSKPADKAPLPLEIFNPKYPDEEVRVRIFVDRNQDRNESPDEVATLTGARQQHLSINTADAAGGLVFKTVVTDWSVELNTKGLFGIVDFEVELRDAKGASLGARAAGQLLIDDSPPDVLEFGPTDTTLVRGEPLTVRARAIDLAPDTGISEVQFFVGAPVDGKTGKEPPANAEKVKGVLVEGYWVAQLPVPDRRGLLTITAQATNGAGQSTFKPVPIQLVDPGAAGGRRFKISGTVVEGEQLQPGVDVVLKDDKGTVKAAVKTAKDEKNVGKFTFENVAPGTYVVSSAKVGSNTKGEAPATVEPADVTGVEIKLYR